MTQSLLDPATLVAARREGGLRRTLHDILLLTQRNLRLDLRNPAVIVGGTAFPVFLLLVFTAGFAKVVMPNSSYADYAQFIVPLSAVQGLLFSTVNVGVALYNDLDSGMDTRLRSLPIARSAALTARILGGAGRLLGQVVVIVLVGYCLGFRFHNGVLAIVAFLLLAVLFTSAFAWIAVFLAVNARSPESVQVSMTPWLLPLTFLSTGYVPKQGFPDWLQGFVELNPVSSATQALRGLASGGAMMAGPLIITLLWSVGLTLVFGTLAIRAYQQRDR